MKVFKLTSSFQSLVECGGCSDCMQEVRCLETVSFLLIQPLASLLQLAAHLDAV